MKTVISSTKALLFSTLSCLILFVLAAGTIPVEVGVVLDLNTWVGELGLSCINVALSDFYSNHSDYKTRLNLNIRDSKRDVVGAAAAALDLVKNVQVQAIIGPESSMQANFVIDLGGKSQVPIISFSATSPFLTSLRSPYFFRAAQNDSSQVKAISAIIQAFGWRQVVPIYEDNEFGEGIVPYLSDSLAEINARIPYRCVISPQASDEEIGQELGKLMAKSTRVFVVHMGSNLGSRIFDKAKEIGMMSQGYVWIITDGLTNLWSNIMDDSSDMDSMQGVLGVQTYVPKSKQLDMFKVRWRRKLLQDNPNMTKNPELDIFGLWAYDATFALAMAVEKIGVANNFSFEFNKSNINVSAGTTTDLESFRVSENGPKLIHALYETRFKGLSGEFGFFSGGQLNSSVFQIINVNGNGKTGIGFWTPEYGFVKKLKFANKTGRGYSTSKDNLGGVIWPGDSYSVPRGWEIPINGNKLRIGVPKKEGFSEFVKVVHDPDTNSYEVRGYCIAIFEAVMNAMPYAVPYNFTPFVNAHGEMNGNYDDLISQVFLGKYDAVVGDVAILANRSLYVDFTLPYTESGVAMVVPIKEDSNKNAWVFLKPLSLDLWVTSGCFFVFIGFIIWVLEHRINEDFRGSPSHQIGTSFWFSFSTMIFAHRERVVNNSARLVVVVWCFVVLILTQSYTASLTTLLTVQQLKPTVTDVNELLKNGKIVAYQDGSFTEGLIKKMGFKSDQMKAFSSPKELDELFTNGSISAAFDEIPYLTLFLASYCHKYTTMEPTFNTDGFGIVFPKGSPLVGDVSRAILKVIEGDKMNEIEKAWLRNSTSCPDSSTLVSSNSLGIESFWGLFLITGVIGVLALLVFAAQFLYQHKEILLDSSKSVLERFIELIKLFYGRDPDSHTMRGRPDEGAESSNAGSARAIAAAADVDVGGEPNNNYLRSLSRIISLSRPSTSGYELVSPSTDTEQDISSSSNRVSPEIEIQPVITNNNE